jgi:D-alanyl-D-alanine carboxypeptidase
MRSIISLSLSLGLAVTLFSGCSSGTPTVQPISAAPTVSITPIETTAAPAATLIVTETPQPTITPEPTKAPITPTKTAKPPKPSNDSTDHGPALSVVAQPESITVLINKQFALPKSYEPADLVYPDVLFVFKEKLDKRKMRKEAAAALETMFAGAKKDHILLAGVSAYRSYSTQKDLFNRYVKKDGLEKARTYSAIPGTSEHETGLAIDVSGSDGKCGAEDCFAGTKEALWLDKHASEYGFIIRYPKGKDAITGYTYEPWHLRYVGKDTAAEIAEKGITLEEYSNAVPVTK